MPSKGPQSRFFSSGRLNYISNRKTRLIRRWFPTSVVNPGRLSGIRLFFHPGSELSTSRIRTISIPYPWSSSKNLSILTPQKKAKKSFSALKNMIGFVHPRSPDPDADFLPSRIHPGVKKILNPGSATWFFKELIVPDPGFNLKNSLRRILN